MVVRQRDNTQDVIGERVIMLIDGNSCWHGLCFPTELILERE